MSSNPHEAPVMELRLFGSAHVYVQGVDITRNLPKKAVMLLALLRLQDGKSIERARIARILWAEASEQAALHNLRQMLAGIRRSLGDARDVVLSTARSLSLDHSKVTSDVIRFDKLCNSDNVSDLQSAVALYARPLLAEFEEPFAIVERDLRFQGFLRAAENLVQKFQAVGDHVSAIA